MMTSTEIANRELTFDEMDAVSGGINRGALNASLIAGFAQLNVGNFVVGGADRMINPQPLPPRQGSSTDPRLFS